jgi:hypothetical protein
LPIQRGLVVAKQVRVGFTNLVLVLVLVEQVTVVTLEINVVVRIRVPVVTTVVRVVGSITVTVVVIVSVMTSVRVSLVGIVTVMLTILTKTVPETFVAVVVVEVVVVLVANVSVEVVLVVTVTVPIVSHRTCPDSKEHPIGLVNMSIIPPTFTNEQLPTPAENPLKVLIWALDDRHATRIAFTVNKVVESIFASCIPNEAQAADAKPAGMLSVISVNPPADTGQTDC